jgi:hypothetical protein
LNGDGLADLCALRLDESRLKGKLLAYRSGPPETWRRLGFWQPDIGERFHIGDVAAPYVAPPSASAQDDRARTADLLAFQPARLSGSPPIPLQGFSSRNGRQLWKAAGISSGSDPLERITRCYWLTRRSDAKGSHIFCAYLQGQPEMVWQPGHGGGSTGWGRIAHRLWLAKIDARTGRGWRTKLGAGFGSGGHSGTVADLPAFQAAISDLNQDGFEDIVVRVYRDEMKDNQPST